MSYREAVEAVLIDSGRFKEATEAYHRVRAQHGSPQPHCPPSDIWLLLESWWQLKTELALALANVEFRAKMTAKAQEERAAAERERDALKRQVAALIDVLRGQTP